MKSITSSLEVANPTCQDSDALTNDTRNDHQNDPLSEGAQDDPQKDPQNAPTGFDPPQGQDSTSVFERCFTNMYSFQTSVMSNLNRLDFKNLQLAGVRTPVSQQIQQNYLIPSKCDERSTLGNVVCSNTTQTVKEIKACHGMHHDGPWLQSRPEKWSEPRYLWKHVHRSNWQEVPNENGGHFDSFNVCIHCHDRDRELRRPYQTSTLRTFYSVMCRPHSLEHAEQRPYNACRCEMFMDKYWRCNGCARNTFHELKRRARAFGDGPHPPATAAQTCLDQSRGTAPRNLIKCPILGCIGPPWMAGPPEKQMCMCRACTAIFPLKDVN